MKMKRLKEWFEWSVVVPMMKLIEWRGVKGLIVGGIIWIGSLWYSKMILGWDVGPTFLP